MRQVVIAGSLALGIAMGCGPDSTGGKKGVGGGGTVEPQEGADAGTIARSDDSSGGLDGGSTDNCGVQDFMLQKGLPPELLVVLDRSLSMNAQPPAGGGSKWQQVTAAVNSTVSTLQGQIKWGLEIFPSNDDCGVGSTVDVPVAASNGSAIAMSIGGKMPGGNTPTADAISRGAAYLSALTSTNPKYLLLASDGEPTCPSTLNAACGCDAPFAPTSTPSGTQCCAGPICLPCGFDPFADPTADAIKAVEAAAKKGVQTFVIGIAANSSADAALNQLADKGGRARTASPKYYPVSSQADLVAAVNAIAGQIISCSFPLSQTPTRPDLVTVSVSGATVARDAGHSNGWDFGPSNGSIQFFGPACSSLQSSGGNVQAIYGCPPVL